MSEKVDSFVLNAYYKHSAERLTDPNYIGYCVLHVRSVAQH